MSWLKTLGTVVSTGLKIFTGFSPIVAATVPSSAGSTIREITDDLTKVSGMVQMVEVMGTTLHDKSLTGADKLKAATPLVAQVLLQSEVMFDATTGKHIEPANQQLFLQGCQKLADGMADVLNSKKAD